MSTMSEKLYHKTFHSESEDDGGGKATNCFLAPLWKSDWVVYAKRPFASPAQVLRYLARYTYRVAISNRRLISIDHRGVTFKWKDYRIEGPERSKQMTLDPHQFIRRFLMHVLPAGFHRIRYYGFRPPQRGVRSSLPASENLHNCGP